MTSSHRGCSFHVAEAEWWRRSVDKWPSGQAASPLFRAGRASVRLAPRYHWRRQLCSIGARTPPPQLPITYFFLPHFGAIKVLSRSLVSNVFRILRTTVIKISLFSFCWKNEMGISHFFVTRRISDPTPVLCDFACVICVISMSFCVPLLAPNPGDATARRYDECSVC